MTLALPLTLPDSVQRVKAQADSLALSHELMHVQSDYYSMSLDERATLLKALSPAHLCKTIIFEITKHTDVSNPRYFCILVQYINKISSDKLGMLMRDLGPVKAGRKKYSARLVDPAVSEELTGFVTGGVSPLGMLNGMPIIVSDVIKELGFFYLGAGHIDYKISLNAKEFCEKMNAIVSDITV